MPLKAIFDGQEVVSIFLSDDEWQQVRAAQRNERNRLQMVDGARAIGKVSNRGLRFFAHASGEGKATTANESRQHLTLKAQIARACARVGWQVDVEAAGDGWIADVLATKDDRRIAIEIQWSHQTQGDYAFRSARYRDAGVESVWLRRVTPGRFVNSGGPNVFDMPIRAADPVDYAAIEVRHQDWTSTKVSVDEFVAAVLDSRIRAVGQEVWVWRERCWRDQCSKVSTLWMVPGERPWPVHRTLAREVRPLVRERSAPLATIAQRETKGRKGTYDALCCAHCGVVFGDQYIFAPSDRHYGKSSQYLPAKDGDAWLAVAPLKQAPERPVASRPPSPPSLKVPKHEGSEADRTDAVTSERTVESTFVTSDFSGEGPPTASTIGQPPKQVWVEKCFRRQCQHRFTAWAVHGEQAYPKVRSLARRAEAKVEPIDGIPLMFMEVRRVDGYGMTYDVPCCPSCRLPVGDLMFDHLKASRLVQ